MFNRTLLLFFILAALTACTALPASSTSTPAASSVTVLSTPTSPTTVSASPTLIPSPSSTPTLPLTRTKTRRSAVEPESIPVRPTKIPTSTPKPIYIVSAPAGLVYSDGSNDWMIDVSGKTKALTDTRTVRDSSSGVMWSSDGRYIYFTLTNKDNLTDIWVKEIATGQKRNLTNTPNRYEDPPVEWPESPDVLAFYSTLGIPDGVGYIGELTIMRADGTGYQVVSKNPVSSPAAFSPDGCTIAYAMYDDANLTPWYYRIGSQPQRFPWKSFGLAQFKTMGFSSPSWSPAGQKIAWWMRSDDENYKKLFGGIGLFDLKSGTAALLDNFLQVVPDGWPGVVQWSPDGEQIAFFGGRHQSEKFGDWGEFGIWTANADGSHLQRVIDLKTEYNVCDWAWQPDGQWLAISCDDPGFSPGIWLVELETGQLLKTNLPDYAQIRDWVRLQP